jgi:hypothetical protein
MGTALDLIAAAGVLAIVYGVWALGYPGVALILLGLAMLLAALALALGQQHSDAPAPTRDGLLPRGSIFPTSPWPSPRQGDHDEAA